MKAPEEIRADEVCFHEDECYLPGHRGIYRAIPHDRDDRADFVLFKNDNRHYVYIKYDTIVWKRQTN